MSLSKEARVIDRDFNLLYLQNLEILENRCFLGRPRPEFNAVTLTSLSLVLNLDLNLVPVGLEYFRAFAFSSEFLVTLFRNETNELKSA